MFLGQSFYGWQARPLKLCQPVLTGFPLPNGNLYVAASLAHYTSASAFHRAKPPGMAPHVLRGRAGIHADIAHSSQNQPEAEMTNPFPATVLQLCVATSISGQIHSSHSFARKHLGGTPLLHPYFCREKCLLAGVSAIRPATNPCLDVFLVDTDLQV